MPANETHSPDSPSASVRIATRESPLALWQARHVAELLAARGIASSIVPLVSSGDVDMRPIDGKRSVGVFTKRIQQALLDDEGDVAVHSLKDLPTEGHQELVLAATPERETVSDCLVSPQGCAVEALPSGAIVGTGSRRRAAQLLKIRPDLQVEPIRGNVQTRLRKMHEGEFDAIVLAAAGLTRLEMDDVPRAELPLDTMLPAPGQGALAIEVRRSDAKTFKAVSQINDLNCSACTTMERVLLARLHGGCLAPIAALGTFRDGRLRLVARVLSADGKECIQADNTETAQGEAAAVLAQAEALAVAVSESLIEQGARELIDSVR